jgi:hypothetical protein
LDKLFCLFMKNFYIFILFLDLEKKGKMKHIFQNKRLLKFHPDWKYFNKPSIPCYLFPKPLLRNRLFFNLYAHINVYSFIIIKKRTFII